MFFIQVKSLAGINYIRASEVIAVSFLDREKCSVVMSGGISLPCTEPASVVSSRIEAAMLGSDVESGESTVEQR